MREILSICIGQAGIQLGSACWELFCLEHDIMPNGQISSKKAIPSDENLGTFFSETEEGKYTPRAAFFDFEPLIINDIINGPYHELYDPSLFVFGNEDSSSCYSRGHYTLGPEIINKILEVIRKMVENCSELEGFLLFHSLGGGTGSGLGSLILENLVMEYIERPKINFSIFPASQNAVSVVEPYNTILSMRSLIGSSDAVVVLDNEAIYQIYQNQLDIKRPTYTNLNRLISQVISSMTASMRFNGDLNASISEFKSNLVPAQNLHFMFPSYAPIIPKENSDNIQDITNAVFDQANSIAKCGPREGKCLASTLMYRGDIVQEDVISSFVNLRTTHTINIDDWCPDGVKWGINTQKAVVFSNDVRRVERSACMISNSTAIADVFARFNRKFDLLFSRRAYVHWFVGEGMEQDEFPEACESMIQIEKEYRDAEVEVNDAEEL